MIKFLKKHFLLILALIYLLFPIDIIPDVLFPVGFFDDATIVALGIIKEIVMIISENSQKKNDKKRVVIEGEEA